MEIPFHSTSILSPTRPQLACRWIYCTSLLLIYNFYRSDHQWRLHIRCRRQRGHIPHKVIHTPEESIHSFTSSVVPFPFTVKCGTQARHHGEVYCDPPFMAPSCTSQVNPDVHSTSQWSLTTRSLSLTGRRKTASYKGRWHGVNERERRVEFKWGSPELILQPFSKFTCTLQTLILLFGR